MPRKIWPLLTLLGLVCQTQVIWSQTPEAESQLLPAPRPTPYALPPVDRQPVLAPFVDPILADSPVAGSGFFTNVDLAILWPHLNSHLTGSPNHGLDTVTLATGTSLGTTVAPGFELGYRLPDQLGEFHLGYRFEVAGRTVSPADTVGGLSERDRLDLNMVDLDWGLWNPFALQPGWNLRFNIGVRVASIYFDTERTFAPPNTSAGALDERATSFFLGFGPEFGAELSRNVLLPGLSVVGRVSGADMFGTVRQAFSETTTTAGFSSDAIHNQVSVPMLTIQAGLSYSPPGWNYSRFWAGYVWEELWQIGRLNNSNADLLNRGLFLRGEINF
jgi:hypothetical protein